MAVLLEEVVLDNPRGVDPNAVRQLALLDGVGEHRGLGVVVPRPGQLVLEEQTDLHRVILSPHGPTVIARKLSRARMASQSARGTRCRAWISRIMRCAACSFENPEGFRFCGSCGAALDAEHPGGERRRVTVAFADLVGYSTLAERIDAEVLQELITETFAELRAEVEAREGRVEKFIGDAVVATFGVSPAHEDDPVRAVDAALAMLAAVQRRTDPSGKALNVRIGVNSGLVVTNPAAGGGTGVLGDAVNVAARPQEAAAPGQA